MENLSDLTNEQLTKELLIALHEETVNSDWARACHKELSSRLKQ